MNFTDAEIVARTQQQLNKSRRMQESLKEQNIELEEQLREGAKVYEYMEKVNTQLFTYLNTQQFLDFRKFHIDLKNSTK
jgi:hypothetical protein